MTKLFLTFFPAIWFCADSDVIYHAILPDGCGGGNAEMLVSWQEFLISYVSGWDGKDRRLGAENNGNVIQLYPALHHGRVGGAQNRILYFVTTLLSQPFIFKLWDTIQ